MKEAIEISEKILEVLKEEEKIRKEERKIADAISEAFKFDGNYEITSISSSDVLKWKFGFKPKTWFTFPDGKVDEVEQVTVEVDIGYTSKHYTVNYEIFVKVFGETIEFNFGYKTNSTDIPIIARNIELIKEILNEIKKMIKNGEKMLEMRKEALNKLINEIGELISIQLI